MKILLVVAFSILALVVPSVVEAHTGNWSFKRTSCNTYSMTLNLSSATPGSHRVIVTKNDRVVRVVDLTNVRNASRVYVETGRLPSSGFYEAHIYNRVGGSYQVKPKMGDFFNPSPGQGYESSSAMSFGAIANCKPTQRIGSSPR